MFFGGLTIALNVFSMVFFVFYHRFQWFSMVPDHWSNDAMVSMDRRGLLVHLRIEIFSTHTITQSKLSFFGLFWPKNGHFLQKSQINFEGSRRIQI